jgi:hypothetical protein
MGPVPSTACPECGAAVPAGGSCRDHFHALLLLESEIPGGPGGWSHFYAVAAYGLQHPEGMGYTAAALAGLRAALADALEGRATLEAIRRRARRGAARAGRVTRRPGDVVPGWRVASWPMSVVDVCAGGVAGYAERVERWARSVRDSLDAADASPSDHRGGPAF